MLKSLVQPLFEGPVDIVGDVHGEIDALRTLMGHLGYNYDGFHPENRHLIFVGDLTDRGPDSPAVVDLVSKLIESKRAQCVLGNHDLNILLGDRKHDNHWFFGEPWSLDGTDEITAAVLADEQIRRKTVQFFSSLPLVLERSDLRVVHACWDDSMVEIARRSSDVLALHHECKTQIDCNLQNRPEFDKTDRNLQHQNHSPVKVLTSGKEHRIETPFFASGKWRLQDRSPWWKDYASEIDCVFGHYSMYRGESDTSSQARCVDFAVAKRWQERKSSTVDGNFRGMLGAIRFPERVVYFDNGEIEQISDGV